MTTAQELTALNNGLSDEVRRNLFAGADRQMIWCSRTDPRFSFYVYVPEREDKNEVLRLFVYVHGTVRRYETDQFSVYKAFAEANRCAVLFPIFPGGVFNENDYNDYKLISAYGFRYDALLLGMVDEIAARYAPIDTSRFYMAGHSGGGQFVNRFFFLHPDRLAGITIGAPGRPTYLDFETDYFWGVKNWRDVFGSEIDREALKNVPVLMTVGAYDTKFIGESAWGTTRLSRLEALRDNFAQHGIDAQLKVVPGMEHAITIRDYYEAHCNFFASLIKNA